MISIQTLLSKTTDSISLQSYLEEHFEKIYDFFEIQKHSDLLESKEELRRYIALNWLILSQLEKNNKTNLSFLSLLLDVCERLGLRAQFKLLYDFLSLTDFNIGNRLQASALYLINVNEIDDYLNRYDSIYTLLQSSYESEEDNKDKVLSTAINYYSQVLIDFGQFNLASVIKLKNKIELTISENEYSFLNDSLIETVLGIDLREYETAYNNIHFLLDSYLGKDVIKPRYNPNFLLETGTEYSETLNDTELNFNLIRQISVKKYGLIADDKIFRSLQRGVNVLTQEHQLFAYMNSYGPMHFEKLNTAFDYLPKLSFKNKVNIIDWGCGQGMATMTYLDYLLKSKIEQSCNQITLIEPSELALKRGSLHVKKYLPSTDIITINKDLDSLLDVDFIITKNISNLHLFSNILDVDLFSLTNLIKKIENNFKGTNYFVCVSPNVTDLKTNRLDTFMKYFSRKENFEELASINNRKGEWKGNPNWTRIVRVFKATIT